MPQMIDHHNPASATQLGLPGLTDGNDGIVPAAEFIHIAEKSNLIITLDR